MSRSISPLRATALAVAACLGAACSSSEPFSIRHLDQYDWEGDRVDSHSALESIERVIAHVDGEQLVGRIAPDGVITIDDLPKGRPFVLEVVGPLIPNDGDLRYRYFLDVDGVTPIRIGGRYYYRETMPTTESLPIDLELTTAVPFEDDDVVTVLSARANSAMVLGYPDLGSAGSTMLGWSFDLLDVDPGEASNAFPELAWGDDLQIVQVRATEVGVTGWSATEVVASTNAAEMTPGDVVTISGALEAPASEREIVLDLPIEAAHAMLGVPAENARLWYANATVYHEPGSGGGMLYGAVPAALQLRGAGPVDRDRSCVEEELLTGTCDFSVCPVDCGVIVTPSPLDDLRTTVRYPEVYTHPGSPVLYVDMAISVNQPHPETLQNVSQPVWISRALPLEDASGVTLEPLVSPPRALRINGNPAPIGSATDVPDAPELAWDPPALGQPDLYEVIVQEVDPSRYEPRVTHLRILTRNTSFRLPPAALVEGRWYTFRVQAHKDGRRVEQPEIYPSREGASATMISGYFGVGTGF